jgi:UDP-N-acetylmuramate dehydrogenase
VSDALRGAEAIMRRRCGQRLRASFPMAQLTTLRIGGPAALYLEPESTDDLQAVSAAVTETAISVVVIGKGSNVLVADEGFPGVVIRLGRAYRWAARDGSTVSAGGSMPLPALAGIAQRHELAGLEFGVAIPASVGGAVKMNAGAHERSMSQVVSSVEVFGLADGRTHVLTAEEAGFDYRTSALGEATVVTSATATLEQGAAEQIRARMQDARDWRRRTQPLAEPNCGSLFKNPPGSHAARLIEEAGLKGFRVGGVAVSTKHANFMIAGTGAKASDARALIEHVQRVVSDRTGIGLEPEVQLIGGTIDALP